MPERSVERSPCWAFVTSSSPPPSQFHRTYPALITHLGQCCLNHQNIDRICLCLTGGPRKCPQLDSGPLPEHATCHHEAYRGAPSVPAATDAGIFPVFHTSSHLSYSRVAVVLWWSDGSGIRCRLWCGVFYFHGSVAGPHVNRGRCL